MALRSPPRQPDLPGVPEFKECPGLSAHLKGMKESVNRELIQRPRREETVPYVLLMSPNGTVYRLSVDDAGTLVTTEMAS